jgi:AcrR family transcriptional regulator
MGGPFWWGSREPTRAPGTKVTYIRVCTKITPRRRRVDDGGVDDERVDGELAGDERVEAERVDGEPAGGAAVSAPASAPRARQAERSARTRGALLESAARGLSRYGYGNLVLERVASEAGYTRGALYHQFKDKEDLALAVIDWVDETWQREVGERVERESDPVAALLAMARGHAVYCRRDVARVVMALRLEFSGQAHPVGRHLERVAQSLVERCTRLITAGRASGAIPPGPPPRVLALAFVGALEGTVIELAGHAPHDETLAARATAGVLGLDTTPPAGVQQR